MQTAAASDSPIALSTALSSDGPVVVAAHHAHGIPPRGRGIARGLGGRARAGYHEMVGVLARKSLRSMVQRPTSWDRLKPLWFQSAT